MIIIHYAGCVLRCSIHLGLLSSAAKTFAVEVYGVEGTINLIELSLFQSMAFIDE